MIFSSQMTNTSIFAFIAVLVFKSLSCKVLFINRKDNRNCQKVVYFLRKQQISRVNFMQNCKQLECNFFRILLKHVSDHLSVNFQFPCLPLITKLTVGTFNSNSHASCLLIQGMRNVLFFYNQYFALQSNLTILRSVSMFNLLLHYLLVIFCLQSAALLPSTF